MKKIFVSMFLLIFGLCLVGCSVPPEPLDPTTMGDLFTNYGFESVYLDQDNVNKMSIGTLQQEEFYQELSSLKVELRKGVVDELDLYHTVYFWSYVSKEKNYINFFGQDDKIMYATVYFNDKVFEVETNVEVFVELINYVSIKDKNYKLTIQNDSSNELIGIKEEYKAGEEVEVKMEYDMAVETYVFLNGELLGTLNGSNSLKFNMPEKDSTLVVTYTNAEIYKVNVIDNFDLLRKPLKSYYIPGEEVEVILQFLSGPRVGIVLNGNKIETTGELVEGLGELFTFTMPNTDSVIYITYNDIICNPDNDEHHKWDEGKHQQVPGGGHDELVYTCEYCGYHKYVDFTYEMQMEKLATIVEKELNELNCEKIIIKDLIKMLEDILVEYELTDTQIKEIEVCVSVLEELDEFDEITKEELELLYKNPDISDNVE